MAWAAKPLNLQRLSIVRMVHFSVRITAFNTGTYGDLPFAFVDIGVASHDAFLTLIHPFHMKQEC